MSAAWTKGPWRLDPEANGAAVIGSRGFLVADCCIFSLRKGAPTDAENRANARLIAAAPDLYEALESMVERHVAHIHVLIEDGHGYRDPEELEDVKVARAALSKARGETE